MAGYEDIQGFSWFYTGDTLNLTYPVDVARNGNDWLLPATQQSSHSSIFRYGHVKQKNFRLEDKSHRLHVISH